MPKGLDCEGKGADDETCRSGTLDTPTVLEGLADGATVVGGGVAIALSELAAIFVPTLVSSTISELGSSAKKNVSLLFRVRYKEGMPTITIVPHPLPYHWPIPAGH